MAQPHRVGFLLIDGFALMSFASAIEPLRAANVLAGKKLYQWLHISTGADAVLASSGLSVASDHTIADNVRYDTVLVCAGGNPASFDDAKTLAWLRRLARSGCAIGGVSGGPFILAKAGILDGMRCTIHWEHLDAFIEAFPDIEPTRTLFEIDRNRLTCAGGVAALDMMHAIIRRDHGQALAAKVSDWFLQTAVRLGDDSQRISLRERLGTSNRAVLSAITVMERRLASPAPRDELAKAAGVSVRQLERLFTTHLGVTIEQHYLTLRLAKARALLRQTGMPVVEVGAECGFASASHFARVYRRAFDVAPSQDRMAKTERKR
ncbi:GlxA family transcriptional regulator [Tardiphaga sp.]|uniref:GlxA family transcriptional regulator n=1 Tax=Tardiphaga sp. TaxID=1926292 RepID=UPI00352BCC38